MKYPSNYFLLVECVDNSAPDQLDAIIDFGIPFLYEDGQEKYYKTIRQINEINLKDQTNMVISEVNEFKVIS